MVPGVFGIPAAAFTARIRGLLVPQSFFAATVIFPLDVPVVTDMEFVLLLPVQPEGKVHIYSVALESLVTEYVLATPGQNGSESPTVIVPG